MSIVPDIAARRGCGSRTAACSDVAGARRSMMMRDANPATAYACFMLIVPLMA
jgi:hypothetical protein